MDLATPRAATARVPWRTIGVLALVALMLVALVAVYAGSQRRVPAPFGPAANGVIPYATGGDILVGDPVTGNTTVIVSGPENDYGPSFSNDGTRIGFVREAATGEDVFVVDADGSGLRKITTAPLQTLITAAWVPDGSGFMVAHDVGGRQVLQVLDVSGSAPVRTLAEGLDADWVVFRPPAGDEMLIRGTVDGVFGLYAMNPDGSDVRRLVEGLAGVPSERFADHQDLNFPAYSPDGSRIYFNRYVPTAETIQAWVMNADGSDMRRFNPSGPACCWWEGEMAPSPDGRWVAMWRTSPSGTGEIVLYPADGSGAGTVIGPYVAGTGLWAWAPDSTRILLNYNNSAEGDQSLIDPETGDTTVLPWRADAMPDWQRTAR